MEYESSFVSKSSDAFFIDYYIENLRFDELIIIIDEARVDFHWQKIGFI